MNNNDRLIAVLYYSIGGVFLGLGLALFSSLYLELETSSIKIVIFTIIACAVIGYLFPDMVAHIFKWVWKVFVN